MGLPPRADGRQLISVGPDQTKEVRVVVTDYSSEPPAPSTSILFKLIDIDSGESAEMRDLITKHEAESLTTLDPKHYASVLQGLKQLASSDV